MFMITERKQKNDFEGGTEMKYAYIGTVKSLNEANRVAAKYRGVVISGIDENGHYELSVEADNEKRIDFFQRQMARGRI